MEQKHSELPFRVGDCGSPEYLDGIRSQYSVQREDGYNIAYTFDKEETEFLTRACNSHYELVAALENALNCATAVVPVSNVDPEAVDAYEMWNDARVNGRAVLARARRFS